MNEVTINPNNVAQPIIASRADRPTSFSVSDFSVPHGREEEWRFTPMARIQDFFADPAEVTRATAPVVTATGIELEKVARTDPRLGRLQAPEDRIGALAWEAPSEAYVVSIPADRELEQEGSLFINGSDDSAVSALELLIEAGENSRGTIIMNHTGSSSLTEGVEISLAAGAHLTLVSIQDWDDNARHALSFRMRAGADAVLKHIVVSLGGSLVRVTSAVEFAGQGADVNLLGAYFADAGQHLEHRLFVDHNQPKCRSHVTYKGALQGDDAHSVWVGDVLIRPEAEGIETYELNRNLVLTEGARADSVPNLEIETGNIEGAGHASATGRFDDEQLFYLRSRGVPEKEARRLVVMGFFAELIKQIGVESVQEKLLAHIDAELGNTMADSLTS